MDSIQGPLCPTLYYLLKGRFRSVKIANRGEAMVSAGRRETAVGRQRLVILSAGEYYRVCCPFCGDTSHRLWINHRWGQPRADGWRDLSLAICYRRGCLRSWDNRKELERLVFGVVNKHERAQFTMPVKEGLTDAADLRPHEPPGVVVPIGQLPAEHHARLFLEGRGYDVAYLQQQYNVCFCVEGDKRYPTAADRIVVPFYMDGLCVGWQSRLPYELSKEELKARNLLKYYTVPTMPRSRVLYNYDVAVKYPFMVITEGVLDAWSVGPMAVATLGKTMPYMQKQRLMVQARNKPLVFMWDEDAIGDMEGVLEDFKRNRSNPVFIVRLPAGRDPGDFTPSTNQNMIYAQASNASFPLPVCHA